MKFFAAFLKTDNDENCLNINNQTVLNEDIVEFTEYLGDSEN